MSSVFYRYENSQTMVKKGVKHVVKESIIDGTQTGISFEFLEKTGEDKFYRVKVKQLESGNYEVKEKKNNDDETTKEVKESDLMKMISGNKSLKFVETYMKKEREALIKDNKKGGSKRKSSKKSSKKKASKKSSKKASRKKASKKSSKKKASRKKSSKKTSKKKVSKKKASKKTSKKKASRKKSSKKKASKKSSKKKASKKSSKKRKSSKK